MTSLSRSSSMSNRIGAAVEPTSISTPALSSTGIPVKNCGEVEVPVLK